MRPFLIRQQSNELRQGDEFRKRAALVNVRLTQFSGHSGQNAAQIEGALQLDVIPDAKEAEVRGELAHFDLNLKIEARGSDNSEALFNLECAYELDYQLLESFVPSRAQLIAFQGGGILLDCWPFAREFVHDSAQRMGIPVAPVPFLHIVPEPGLKEQVPKRKHVEPVQSGADLLEPADQTTLNVQRARPKRRQSA